MDQSCDCESAFQMEFTKFTEMLAVQQSYTVLLSSLFDAMNIALYLSSAILCFKSKESFLNFD